MTRSLFTLFAAALAFLAVGCAIGLDTQSAKATYRTLALETENLSRQSGSPSLQAARVLLKRAAKTAADRPSTAAALYLEAAEHSLPLALRDDEMPASLATRYYRHAAGHATALIHRHDLWGTPLTGPTKTYHVRARSGAGLLDPARFDDLTFADSAKLDDLDIIARRDGFGAPMVATLHHTSKRVAEHPFLSLAGFDLAATAVVEFGRGADVAIALYDSRRVAAAPVAGRTRPLAANFSVPLVMTMTRPDDPFLGVFGMFKPATYFDAMGLYGFAPLEPNRIPLVFIHGLISDPQTFTEACNAVLAEPDLRDNYQVFVFYYPTGLHPMYSAAGLRAALDNLHEWQQSRRVGPRAERMVLVGHSMGGLLTSTQIRNYRGAWDELFVSPLHALPVAPTSLATLEALFDSPAPRYVRRAVFVATPHRGSNLANSWLGRFASNLAKIPEHLLSLQIPAAARAMTDLGRNILLDANPVDAIQGLRYGNPVLRFNESRDVAPWIPYHSIIGDRGKGDTPDSSDGVVPYSSSHLDGAQSERIVPSNHRVHIHPEGIAEIKRILELHLDSRPNGS